VKLLRGLENRKEVVLPVGLKRERSEQFLDEENFDKLAKKIKID
jgi:hypothetical protein